ncbi:MAG: ABC transporter permease [Planctomycetota bacterium]|nr:ABC transporter permease [Planctomycetota bacterium]
MHSSLEINSGAIDNADASPVALPRPDGPTGAEHLDQSITVIEPTPGWRVIDFAELKKYRELLYFLVWRDVKVRYKQTVLGAAWAILQPLATMVVFSLFFGRLAELGSEGIPYPLFVFGAILPWLFFSNSIAQAGNSVVNSQNLVTKVYFPRLFIPVSSVVAGLVDFAIAFGMLIVLMAYYGQMPGVGVLLLPAILGMLVLAAVGVGTLLAALTVAYRDFRHVIPFMIQLWMFATPCIYMPPTTIESPRWHDVLPLNPAYGLIANFRAAALGMPLDWYSLTVSSVVSLIILIFSCLYFRRVERSFADII